MSTCIRWKLQIQPNTKSRYAIWPSVGVVEPGECAIVSIVLLERARSELEQFNARMDKTEQIVVEWCRAPEIVFKQLGLMVDSDQDHDILSSFWSTRGHQFSTRVTSEKQHLEVHFDLHKPVVSNKEWYARVLDFEIPPTVSMEASSENDDPSLECDDSLMLSVSTWDGESHHQKRRNHGPTHPTEAAPSKNPSIHKFQLQQTLRCRGCYQVFSRDPDHYTIPVMSQSCGHTICRGCVLRQADQDYDFAKEYQHTVSCPLCHATQAFSQQLHINHSLCSVIALIDP
jgi:RING-type zinc-finger